MAEVMVVAAEDYVICHSHRFIEEAGICGAVVKASEISNHWWIVHRADRDGPALIQEIKVVVFPKIRNWPMDYYRRKFPWTIKFGDGHDTSPLDLIESRFTFDALIRKQQHIRNHILNWEPR